MKNKKNLKIFPKKKNFGFEKSKFANRLKRALPKFRGDRSEVRGVNGRSKFAVTAVHRKMWRYLFRDAVKQSAATMQFREPQETASRTAAASSLKPSPPFCPRWLKTTSHDKTNFKNLVDVRRRTSTKFLKLVLSRLVVVIAGDILQNTPAAPANVHAIVTGRCTDGEKSKNEPRASYRPKNLTI